MQLLRFLKKRKIHSENGELGYFNEKDEWVALRDSARHVVYVTPLLFRGTTMIEDTVTIDKRKRKVEEKVMNSGVQRMPRFIFTPTHYLPVKL